MKLLLFFILWRVSEQSPLMGGLIIGFLIGGVIGVLLGRHAMRLAFVSHLNYDSLRTRGKKNCFFCNEERQDMSR